MALINKPLIPVKVLMFFVIGGYGCLWPFLSVHMKELGLTIEETAIINLVTPFTSLLGPPLIAVLTAKSRNPKLVFSICLILSGFAFTGLLFVPPTIRHQPRQPHILFECDYEGGRVLVERCDHVCRLPQISPDPSTLILRQCVYVCDEDAVGGLGEGVPSKPYICAEENGRTTCQVFNMSGHAYDLKLSVPYMDVEETSETCDYPLVKVTNGSHVAPLVHCRLKQPGCAVHCIGVTEEQSILFPSQLPTPSPQMQVAQTQQHDILTDVDTNLEGMPVDVPKPEEPQTPTFPTHEEPQPYEPSAHDDNIHVHQCQKIEGHPLLTFFAYLVLRIVAEFFMYSSLALLEATVTNNMWEFEGFFSRQFIYGILPIGLLCPVIGVLIDTYEGLMPMGLHYAPVFAIFDLFIILTVISFTFLPIKVYNCVNKLGSYIGRISTSGEVITFFIMMMLLGTVFGFVETFYYWFLYDKGANHLFMGLTLTVGIFPSIPLLVFGDAIVRKCGHANFIIAAFFAYSIRLLGYSILNDFRYYFPFEVFKVLSHFLMWVAAVTYCEKLGPKVISPTITGTMGFMHNNIGRGIGALIGGYIMNYFGAITSFRVAAIYSGIIGLIYMATYHFYIKDRKAPICIESSLNGHYTPMEPYPNGDNQMNRPLIKTKNRY
ncbi:hypothetical protein CHUAL_002011 [Chamberlinius hualienensis]